MAILIHGVAQPVLCINPIKDIWMITWGSKVEEDGTTSYLSEVIEHKPSIEEIKKIILDWYNTEINNLILSGFTWNNMSVWLSMENQFNYKAAYDLAVQTNGELLPTFKFGTVNKPEYYKFKSLEDILDFYLEAMAYINETLNKGWKIKDTINWKEYEELLN